MNNRNEGKFALLVLVLFLLLIAFCAITVAKAEATDEPAEQNEAVIISDTLFKSGLPNNYFLFECQLVGIDVEAFFGDEPLTAEIIFPYNIDSLEHVILSDGYSMINGHFRKLDSFTIEVTFQYSKLERFDNNFYLFLLFIGRDMT